MKLSPLIRSNLKIFISIALIAYMGMITLISLMSSYQTLSVSLEDFRNNYGFADITITTTIMTDDSNLIESIENINGVEAAETRLVIDMQLTRSDGRGITGRMMSYSEKGSFNTLNIIKSGGIRLKKNCHLINKRTCSSCIPFMRCSIPLLK